jgi:ferredoxin-NADP reductase
VVLADYPDLGSHDVYTCGNPDMTAAARADFAAAGLDPDRFFCDAFVASGDAQPIAG